MSVCSASIEFAAIWWQQGNISASERTYKGVRGHPSLPYHVKNRGAGLRRVTEPTGGVKKVASGHLDRVLGKWNSVDNR